MDGELCVADMGTLHGQNLNPWSLDYVPITPSLSQTAVLFELCIFVVGAGGARYEEFCWSTETVSFISRDIANFSEIMSGDDFE